MNSWDPWLIYLISNQLNTLFIMIALSYTQVILFRTIAFEIEMRCSFLFLVFLLCLLKSRTFITSSCESKAFVNMCDFPLALFS